MRDCRNVTRIRSRGGVAGLALVLILTGCSGSGDPSGTPVTSDEEQTPDVHATGADPSEDAAEESGGVVDPGPGLYQVDLATGETEPILSGAGELHEPERSPVGSTLVYQGTTRSGIPQIFVLEEGKRRQLTHLRGGALEPTWSPDGTQIAFAGGRSEGGDSDIFVMDADGEHIRPLGRTPRYDRRPDWSPDGTRIAFDTYGLIWVLSVDNGELTPLFNYHGSAVDATWSPDGRWIAFTRLSGSGLNGLLTWSHLWIARSDGSGKRPLALEWENWVNEAEPSWSPDGSSIAYSTVGGNIAIIDVRTSEQLAYLSTRLSASDLSWGTDGLIASVGYARHPGALLSPPIWVPSLGDRDPGFDRDA